MKFKNYILFLIAFLSSAEAITGSLHAASSTAQANQKPGFLKRQWNTTKRIIEGVPHGLANGSVMANLAGAGAIEYFGENSMKEDGNDGIIDVVLPFLVGSLGSSGAHYLLADKLAPTNPRKYTPWILLNMLGSGYAMYKLPQLAEKYYDPIIGTSQLAQQYREALEKIEMPKDSYKRFKIHLGEKFFGELKDFDIPNFDIPNNDDLLYPMAKHRRISNLVSRGEFLNKKSLSKEDLTAVELLFLLNKKYNRIIKIGKTLAHFANSNAHFGRIYQQNEEHFATSRYNNGWGALEQKAQSIGAWDKEKSRFSRNLTEEQKKKMAEPIEMSWDKGRYKYKFSAPYDKEKKRLRWKVKKLVEDGTEIKE